MQPGEVRELTIKPELLGDGSPLLMEAELISTRPPAFTLVKAEGEWIDGMAEGSRALRVSIAMMNQSQETFVKIHCVPTISVDFANGHTVDIDGGNMCDHSAVAAISLLFGEPGFAAAAGAATFSAEPDESIEATNDCPPLCFEGPTIGSAYMNYEIQSVFLVVVVDGETPFGKRAKEAVIARFIPPPSERAVFPLMKSADTLVLAQGEEGQKPGTSDIERPRRQNEVEAPAAEAAAREPPQQQELASEIAPREAVSSGELASYAYAIRQQIEQNWIRPASAGPDIECVVNVRQNPDGEVASTTIERCNGDASVRQSIEAAVFAASPLPMPENPALFERNLRITFKPQQ